MQAACTVSSGGLPFGRRFRPAGALAADLVTEEYLTKHILHRQLYAREAAPRPPFHQQQHSAALPFDDNVHNRFHRQTEPLRNPLATPPPAAAAPPVPPAAGRPRRACCVSAARASKAFQEQHRPTMSSKRSEDPDRKGVVSARLRKQQQQQQHEQQRNKGTGWRAQAEREERRASSRRKAPKEEGGNTRRRGGGSSHLPSVNAFRRAYDEGRLPCSVLHHQAGGARGRGNGVKWHVPPEVLDMRVHLPLFLYGLLETQDPYRFLAIQGALDLIQAGKEQLPAALPHILPPLKAALAASDPIVVATALNILQDMVLADPHRVGPALVPHYHSLLGAGAVFQRHKDASTTGGGGKDSNADHIRRLCLRRLVNDTLELLERTGGTQAFVHIRYMIPSYERTVHAF